MLLIARIVRLAGPAAIALLVASISIHVFDVAADRGVAHSIESAARTLGSPFAELFLPADAKLRVALNQGFAAAFYGLLAPLVAYLLVRADTGIDNRRRARRT